MTTVAWVGTVHGESWTTGREPVTAVAPQPIVTRPRPVRPIVKGSALLNLLQTTDHKVIGMLYLVTSMTLRQIRASTRHSRWAASIRS